MASLPWWAFSPSPFTIAFYVLLTLYAFTKLPRRPRWKGSLLTLTEGAFLVGFTVLSTDFIWVVVCASRFGAMYPDSVLQLVLCAFRDLAIVWLCFWMVADHFKNKVVSFNQTSFFALFINAVFITFWFIASPTPAYTDWTFAIRHNYPMQTVWSSFFLSHIIGKALVALQFGTLFQQQH